MEEDIIINIDSRYRNIFKYKSGSKFSINFSNEYKNIISAKLLSIEINNNVAYIDNKKKNNFITIHLPNKINDPEGTKLLINDNLYQIITTLKEVFNEVLSNLFNSNYVLHKNSNIEKYFYIFYLVSNVELHFDFNNENLPSSLSNKFILNEGWHSIYGITNQIKKYITEKYNERRIYKNNNPNIQFIELDNGNFTMINENDVLTLPIFDRRFRSENYDSIRYDLIQNETFNKNSLNLNLSDFKKHIYKTYINDISTFVLQTKTTYNLFNEHGILDKLKAGEYIIPMDPITISSGNISPNYSLKGDKLKSNSIYYLNMGSLIKSFEPNENSTQLYNLQMLINIMTLKIRFSNYFTPTDKNKFYYYYVSPPNQGDEQTWSFINNNEIVNGFSNLLNKDFLLQEKFITQQQYDNLFFEYNLNKDIAEFEIDFTTDIIQNPVDDNGHIQLDKISYNSVGFYLGYRANLNTSSFIFMGTIDKTERNIKASSIYHTEGDTYVFLKINDGIRDWGYIDFFNKNMFAKILLDTGLCKYKIEDRINKEYRFRQPRNIKKLDIELVDYLGNLVDLGNFEWSFSIELNQIINYEDKQMTEYNSSVFKN
jgi:hypothetical protein